MEVHSLKRSRINIKKFELLVCKNKMIWIPRQNNKDDKDKTAG